MSIVFRNDGSKWQKANKVEFRDEAHLQKLLYESPELIPTYDDEGPATFIREAGLPGSGYTDLLGVDTHGNILVVETKLARNDEVRRKVIGQVLEYAAYLWRMPFEHFDGLFITRAGSSVIDLVEAKASGVSREALRKAIVTNLESGAFQLFIAVDTMNEELEKIIGYVSSRGSGLRLEVLEFDLHQSGHLEILVPRRYGQVLANSDVQTAKPRILTLDEISANAPDERSRQAFQLLEELWERQGHLIKPGTVGASFQAMIDGRPRPIFWAFPDYLQNAFNEIAKGGAPVSDLQKYRHAVASLPGFNKPDILNKAQPITKFASLPEETVRHFVRLSGELVDDWRTNGDRHIESQKKAE